VQSAFQFNPLYRIAQSVLFVAHPGALGLRKEYAAFSRLVQCTGRIIRRKRSLSHSVRIYVRCACAKNTTCFSILRKAAQLSCVEIYRQKAEFVSFAAHAIAPRMRGGFVPARHPATAGRKPKPKMAFLNLFQGADMSAVSQ